MMKPLFKYFKQFNYHKYVVSVCVPMCFVVMTLAGCAHQGSLRPESPETPDADPDMARAYPQAPNYGQAAAELEGSLAKKMGDKVSAADLASMRSAATQLAESLPNPGLQVGDSAPHFTLPNAFGDTVSLYRLLESGPVVLVFYRGNWCPYCNLHLRSLTTISPMLEERGAQLVAVTPQQPDESLKHVKAQGYPFEILSDLDYSVTAAFDLYFELSPELQRIYKKFGVDLEAVNGAGRTALPVPGTFVIDQSGIIRAAQADTDYKKRMEPAAILSAIDEIVASDPQATDATEQ